jgi:bifunctional DNA-binding transcriptional regulator/antitoxin component of YhaV-PrlF toxin-antitoxin module
MEKEKLNLKEPEKVEAYVSGEGITLTPPQPTIMLEFHKDGKYSCLDFKDGEWQFWGTMPIGKSANLFWKEVISKLAKQKTENLLLQEKAKWKEKIEKIAHNTHIKIDDNGDYKDGLWVSAFLDYLLNLIDKL